MTKPRLWPTLMKEHRDRAAEELLHAIVELRPLVLGKVQFNRTEELRRFSAALSHIEAALRRLVQAGAPIQHKD